jgi:two-component system C4-dicarboxylate transport response regulator DctD
VRELRNAAERFALGLDLEIAPDTPESDDANSLAAQMARHEKSLIAAAIAANRGSLKTTYEALGLSRKSLYEKMQKHGLNRADFQDEE